MEEAYLLWLIRRSLPGSSYALTETDDESARLAAGRENFDWEKFCHMAERHGVLPLLYDALEDVQLPDHVRKRAEDAARRAVLQSYRILFLCKYLVGKLEQEGLSVAVLKGVGTASFYPVPELRKSGDVDLLLPDGKSLKRVETILKECGFVLGKEQHGLHHVVYETEDGIGVEIHTMLAEPFDDRRINRYLEDRLEECGRNIVRADCMGVKLPILQDGYHAYELLLHMLQHFLYAGFGLKLLCDWVAFWSREIPKEEQEKYLQLVKESGVRGFSDIVTGTCVRYLGLGRETVSWMKLPEEDDVVEEFMRETMTAEEFGYSTLDRMVALRSGSLPEYVREFHHQMHLNFPRSGKCFLFWPVLWVITLGRFLYNNRKLRKVSTRAVLKNARQRGLLRAKMRLWEKG